MAFPTLIVEVAFTTDPYATPVWTDVSAYVSRVSTRRGRSHELDQASAGTASVVLRNEDRRFDPEHTGGAYYPNVKPGKRIRIRATFNAVTYDLFTGFVDRWPQKYNPPNVATCELQATDGFKRLAKTPLGSVVDQTMRTYTADVATWYPLGDKPTSEYAVDPLTGRSGLYSGDPERGAGGLAAFDDATSVMFDGLDDRVIGDYLDLVGTASASDRDDCGISALISIDTINDDVAPYLGFICGIEQGVDNACYLRLGDGTLGNARRLVFVVSVAGAQYAVTSSIDLQDGRTYVVMGARSPGGTRRVWVDNVEVGSSSSGPTSNFYAAGPVLVGGQSDDPGHGRNFRGRVQHATMWRSDRLNFPADRLAIHNALANPWSGDTSGDRVQRVLTAAAWPAADRDIDTGFAAIAPGNVKGQSALEHLQNVHGTELGMLHIDPTGKVVFVGRVDMLAGVYANSQATFGDLSPELGISIDGFELDYDEDEIRNDARVSPVGGEEQVSKSQASITANGHNPHSASTLDSTPAAAKAHADYIVHRYKDPLLRASAMTIRPTGDMNNLFPAVLGRELGHAITVKRRPQGVGSVISKLVRIEQIEHNIEADLQWETTFTTSPVDPNTYWVLGDSTLGVLGSTTRIFF